MDLGTRIRHLREKLGMNRKELAHGIVSYSHMSNIESGRFVPGDDVLRLLAKKLQVPEDYLLLHNEKDEDLEKLLDEINEMLEVHEDTDRAEQLLNQIEEQYGERINSTEQEVYYYLLKCQSKFITSPNQGKILYEETNHLFANHSRWSSVNKNVIWKINLVSYHNYYLLWEFKKSYNYALKLLDYCTCSFQEGEAYYCIARAELKLVHFSNAISNTRYAIQKYRENNNWPKVIKAYLVLNAIYYDMNQCDKSKEIGLMALELSEKHNVAKHRHIIYHNLGLIFHIKGDLYNSRIYYLKALNILKKDKIYTPILTAYRSIIVNCLESNDPRLARNYIEESKQHCTNKFDQIILDFFIAKVYFLEGEIDVFEQKMAATINYCYKNKFTRHITDYAQEFADYYYENRQYKKASYYYKVNIESYNLRYNNHYFIYSMIVE